MEHLRNLVWATVCALFVLGAGPASASDESDVNAVIQKWVDDFNKGDLKSFVAACAARTSVVDGFPPYAWQTCGDWMNAYAANNKAIQAPDGTLSIGKPLYTELTADRAYMIYPATFTDTQKGKKIVYIGSWTMTLEKRRNGWVFTGSASAWGGNYAIRNRG